MFRLLQDVRFALRKFRQAPGPILAAMVTLAFGIGANSAIFSIADAIWLRPLPITDPSHLVALASVKTATHLRIPKVRQTVLHRVQRCPPARAGVLRCGGARSHGDQS